MHPDKIETVSGTAPAGTIFGAIPARYGSTRLPAKALVDLDGRPMIEHVWRRSTQASGLDRVVVLTDDERIATVVRDFGGEVEMTPASCASGTDRIAHAASNWTCDGVVNIQGDEPLIDPGGISRVAAHLREHVEDGVVTLAADAQPHDGDNPAAVKVVLDRDGYALYFSRAAIPFARNPGGAAPLRHLGIYGYRRDTLLRLATLEPTPLELSESLEQLRALENGIRIRVLTGARPSWGVDTEEDVAVIVQHLRRLVPSGGER